MTGPRRVFVTRCGVVTCVGRGERALREALSDPPVNRFKPPTLVRLPDDVAPCPVGEIAGIDEAGDRAAAVGQPDAGAARGDRASPEPRTHVLALEAACEALGTPPVPVDAVIVGTTTGGITATERALAQGSRNPEHFRFHGLDTVASLLAEQVGADGLAIAISTACSSSAVAIALGRELIRFGLARRVLSGGADALCRLTYHGFRELRLLSPGPARPLDVGRAGLTLAEGAAFVLLEAEPGSSSQPAYELCGTGLSCDAYHATKPHPQAAGAVRAMRAALADAGVRPEDIDYINLHGTGTVDSDASEAMAIRSVFGGASVALSSTKGLTGHLLGAAGAVEAAVSMAAIRDGIVPGNFGLQRVDPAFGLILSPHTTQARIGAVLSNSFGFGGNNVSLVLRPVDRARADTPSPQPSGSGCEAPERNADCGATLPSLRVLSTAVATASGDLAATWDAFTAGRAIHGMAKDEAFDTHVPVAMRRRMKRLTRMMVGLGCRVHGDSRMATPPDILSAGTGWGSIADTYDYLAKLAESGDRFASPMDFVGSVHNASAAQLAIALGAVGPNITCSSGDRSFEHAVLAAQLLGRGASRNVLLVGADAWHDTLSSLLDPDGAVGGPTDGGAAIAATLDEGEDGVRLRFLGEQRERAGSGALDRLLAQLGGVERVRQRYGVVLVGAPARHRSHAAPQLDDIVQRLGGHVPVRAYRPQLGEHASTSAIACIVALRMVQTGSARAVLLLTLGGSITAMEVVGA